MMLLLSAGCALAACCAHKSFPAPEGTWWRTDHRVAHARPSPKNLHGAVSSTLTLSGVMTLQQKLTSALNVSCSFEFC